MERDPLITFGALVLPNESWGQLTTRWARLDAGGLDSVWSCDHFTNPHQPGQRWFEGIVSLAGLAQVTRRARIGLLVGAIVSRPPMLLAKQALALDHMSAGRLTIGLGAGGAPSDQAMWGVPPWSPSERVKRFGEYVELLDWVLRHDAGDYLGQWYRTERPAMAPGCVQQPRPPILLAAHGPASIRIAARFADTWNTLGPTLEAACEAMSRLDTACADIGRDSSRIRRSVLFGVRPDTAWRHPSDFANLVRRWYDAGFRDFIVYDPPYAATGLPVADDLAVDELMAETIPSLRREFA